MSTLARIEVLLARFTRARPRLLMSVGAGLAVLVVLALVDKPDRWVTKCLIAWDGMLVVYLALVGSMMARSGVSDLKRRAAVNDDRDLVILVLIIIAILASLLAIVVELATPGQGVGRAGVALSHVLALVTVVLSWFFTHVVFAVHYAHGYYAPADHGHAGGLAIPGDEQPDYRDFLYFSFVIGCAAATADINITSRQMRTLALIHGVLSFAYNTAIVALTINIAASNVG